MMNAIDQRAAPQGTASRNTRGHRATLGGMLILIGLAALVALLASGCGKGPRKAVGKLDTPEHHTLRGHDFIDKGEWDKAERSFDLAIDLGKDYGPAYAGKAIVVAHKSAAPGLDEDQREDLAKKAEDLIDDAFDNVKEPDDKRTVHVAAIRVFRHAKIPEDWLSEAEGHYEDAVDLDKRDVDPTPHFYMARAYRDAFEMRKAEDLYRRVLGMKTPLSRDADMELEIVQKIQRAAPGSRHGKVIAFEPSISRADIAALFIEELRLDRLYARGSNSRFDTGFKAPQSGAKTFQAETLVRAEAATDIKDHPLQGDIEEIMKLGVAGLEPDPAHLFHPNDTLRRGEFALMVEDILVKVTGEKGLRTKFIGQRSPFPDVRGDHPWFNAVQTVTSRSLMQPVDKVNGVFGLSDPITGADALLVLRLLKDELRSYLRG